MTEKLIIFFNIFAVVSNVFIIYLLQTEAEEELLNKKRSKKVQKKYEVRQRTSKVEPAIEEQFQTGRLLGKIFKKVLDFNLNLAFPIKKIK